MSWKKKYAKDWGRLGLKCEWKECFISDLGIVITGKTPSTKIDKNFGYEYPFITPKDIQVIKHIFLCERYLSSTGAKNVKGCIIPKNSVCVSCIGNLGYVAMTTTNSVTNQQINTIIPDCGKHDPDFVFYLMKYLNPYFKNLENQSTTLSILNKSLFSQIPIKIPFNIEKQRAIAATLSCLDEKIELNNRMNKTLEEMAQAIFKSWFVDFEPWGGVMPEGWKNGTLSELITIKYGKDHKKLSDGTIPVFGSGGIMRFVDTALYNKESVLIPRKGTLNNVFHISQPFWSVDTMFYSEMKYSNIAKYIYFFLCSKDLSSMNAGSAVPSMTTEILNSLQIIIPPDEELAKFENVVGVPFEQMQKNQRESDIISAIRDALLPKLMSGEINPTTAAEVPLPFQGMQGK
jgi:type I restriction enzyme S subunit